MTQFALDASRSQWQLNRHKSVAVISLEGELSHGQEGDKTISEVLRCVGTGETHLLMDLTCSHFVNASICGFLVSLFKRCREKNVEMGLIIPFGSSAGEVVRKSGIGRLLRVYVSLDHFHMEENIRLAEEAEARLPLVEEALEPVL